MNPQYLPPQHQQLQPSNFAPPPLNGVQNRSLGNSSGAGLEPINNNYSTGNVPNSGNINQNGQPPLTTFSGKTGGSEETTPFIPGGPKIQQRLPPSQMPLEPVQLPVGSNRTSPGPGYIPPPPGQLPPSMNQVLPQSGPVGQQSSQMPSHPSQIPSPAQFRSSTGPSPPTGQIPSSTGQMSSSTNQISPPTGQIPPPTGQLPPTTGQMSHSPSQSRPASGQIPPMNSQVPSVPGQISSLPGGPPMPRTGPPFMHSRAPVPPGQVTSFSSQSSQMPGQRPLPGQGQGQRLPLGGQMPPVGGQMPPLGVQVPTMSGQMRSMPAQQQSMPGHMPPLPGQISSTPGQMPPLPGQVPPLPGQMPPMPGQMPPMPGQMPPMPGQMPPMPGKSSSMPGQIPSMPGQMPSMPGQIPSMSGQIPSMPGQMPPMAGQMPPLPGQPPRPTQNTSFGEMPPVPGQVNGPNQLVNQLQSMNLNEPRPGPHMPPPLNQGGFNQKLGSPPMPQGAGYPPMSQGPGGYPPMSQGPGGYPQSGYPQQPMQQQKRLDPDQMPSPIQVTQDDQRNRSGPFITNQKGLVPPLVTTKFVVQDQGNSSPRFIRSSMYNVPISQDIMKQTAVPFSLCISPMARLAEEEYAPPIVNFGDLGPVRCIRCKAYMCPYMQFIDSGRRFQCLFCKATTDVPAEYFQHLDHTGQRMDKYERPELVLGTYEFVATADYCRNNQLPKPPAVIFVIDVSYNNMKSGLVHLLCSQMKEIIKNLPVDQGQEKSNMRVGFITYNSTVHFYNIKGTLAAPQMMVVGDTQEMFMPLLDGFLCTPEESEAVIDALMEQIPAMFADTKDTEIILLPAILAGLEALKASECAGKLIVFHSTLPTANAPGILKNRDDRKLLATDKERIVLTPQTQAYNQLGQDCVAAGCSVDLFIFNNSYIDIATIGQVSRLTGGEVFKYTYFQADVDGERVIRDVIMDVSRPIAFDGIMRVRTSTGVRPTDFYGHFFMSNTTDMELAAIDCDKGIAIEIKHDDKLSEEEGVYIQSALLYTSCSGQRRLRIMNLSLKTCSQMADLYRSCDLDTIINYISKQSTFKLLDNSPKAVKDNIVNRAAQILASYRKNCATPSSAGQLILPECMKLLPLYVNCLLKSDALSGGSDMTVDDRAFVMQTVMTMDIPTSLNYFYPRLIPIHDLDASKDPVEIPAPIRCTIEKMTDQGVYILENGIHMFIWVGLGASPDITQNVFGAPSAIQIDIEKPYLPELDNSFSIAVRNIIEEIRAQRHRCMRLTIVRQREKLEPIFKHFLVEDRGTDGSASYVDFLCHMHKEIRTLLS